MLKRSIVFAILSCIFVGINAVEYHVSISKGSDSNKGTKESPFRTINHAAQIAYPGDKIIVHEGVYREWVKPQRGGFSDNERIVYCAADNEDVYIKGSDVLTDWEKVKGYKGVWKCVVPHSYFGESTNPLINKVEGDWFTACDRIHHLSDLFLNDVSLFEVSTFEEMLDNNPLPYTKESKRSLYKWYCENTDDKSILWVNFQNVDPNKELIELSVRHTCFYPLKKGINYITISGFKFCQIASQWAPPSAEQIGAVATNWNKGWIIEGNEVYNSRCVGITLGKDRESGHNDWLRDPTVDVSVQYLGVIFNALELGWNKDNIGSHIVKNNIIHDCEQAGICGSMGAAFSLIENNHIYNIWVKRQFSGVELAGIKFHGAIDTRILNNRIHNTPRGLWLDWMSQGTRVSNNLFYDNDSEDIWVEVNHGPFVIDNNILCSPVSLYDQSQGGAYIHNMFAGKIRRATVHERYTPYHRPHSTSVAGVSIVPGGDCRYYNNLFLSTYSKENITENVNFGLSIYNQTHYQMYVANNVYFRYAEPYNNETSPIMFTENVPNYSFIEDDKKITIKYFLPKDVKANQITTDVLGRNTTTGLPYEDFHGNKIIFDIDINGCKRKYFTPGPIEDINKNGELEYIFKK